VLVQVAHTQYTRAVGLDVGFRWLIVARRGLEERGITPRLVCGSADHLPFADRTFDTVTSVALLEHMSSAMSTLEEFARVQKPGGRTVVWTSNRFSLAPEPHVRIWGVGFLPRRFMPAFVHWRRGLAYTGKTLLSRFELARVATRAGYSQAAFHLPQVATADLQYASPLERAAARVYALVRRIAPLRYPTIVFFPALLAVFTRRSLPMDQS
jgi:ubiquinone/menaquinone biosynthesis C-methylase UbiE